MTSLRYETLEQLARFGRKLARVHRHFADEDAERDLDEAAGRGAGGAEWRRMKAEFRELVGELREALREKIDAPAAEKQRVLGALRSALAAVRKPCAAARPPQRARQFIGLLIRDEVRRTRRTFRRRQDAAVERPGPGRRFPTFSKSAATLLSDPGVSGS